MNDTSLVTLEKKIYWLDFPNNLPKRKAQMPWSPTESNMTDVCAKDYLLEVASILGGEVWKDYKHGETRSIKSKAKQDRFQMLHLTVVLPTLVWVALTACATLATKSHAET